MTNQDARRQGVLFAAAAVLALTAVASQAQRIPNVSTPDLLRPANKAEIWVSLQKISLDSAVFDHLLTNGYAAACTLATPDTCTECSGRGRIRRECQVCGGKGEVKKSPSELDEERAARQQRLQGRTGQKLIRAGSGTEIRIFKLCPSCGGKGYDIDSACTVCKGSGESLSGTSVCYVVASGAPEGAAAERLLRKPFAELKLADGSVLQDARLLQTSAQRVQVAHAKGTGWYRLSDFDSAVSADILKGLSPVLWRIGQGGYKGILDLDELAKSGEAFIPYLVRRGEKGLLGESLRALSADSRHNLTADQRVLHMAADGGDLAVVKLLLDAGISPDERDAQGQTLLHAAYQRKDEGLRALMLAAGADPTIKDFAGKTPADYEEKPPPPPPPPPPPLSPWKLFCEGLAKLVSSPLVICLVPAAVIVFLIAIAWRAIDDWFYDKRMTQGRARRPRRQPPPRPEA